MSLLNIELQVSIFQFDQEDGNPKRRLGMVGESRCQIAINVALEGLDLQVKKTWGSKGKIDAIIIRTMFKELINLISISKMS